MSRAGAPSDGPARIAAGEARDGRDTMAGQYVVYQDDRGRWSASESIGGDPIGGVEARTPHEALDVLRAHLAAKGEAMSTVVPGERLFHVESGPPRPGRPDVTLRLSAVPWLADLVAEMSSELKMPTVETIGQALVMLKIAVDAGKAGNRLAITDDDFHVLQEILIPGRHDDEAR